MPRPLIGRRWATDGPGPGISAAQKGQLSKNAKNERPGKGDIGEKEGKRFLFVAAARQAENAVNADCFNPVPGQVAATAAPQIRLSHSKTRGRVNQPAAIGAHRTDKGTHPVAADDLNVFVHEREPARQIRFSDDVPSKPMSPIQTKSQSLDAAISVDEHHPLWCLVGKHTFRMSANSQHNQSNGPAPLGVPPPPMPGMTIAALAVAAGANRFDAALGLAAVLGAIAGPLAGPQSMAGDLIHPGFHLVVAASRSGSWRRLEDLLLQPVAASQKRLRELSRITSAARLDHLQFSRFADPTNDLVELMKPGRWRDPGIPEVPDYPESNIAAFRTPTFFLRSPDHAAWTKAQSEILDATAFVWNDGSILDLSRVDRSTVSPVTPARELIAAATGCDRYIERGKQVGPGRLDLVKANLFVSTSREVVANALDSEDHDVRQLLQACVFVTPSRDPFPITLDSASIRAGYEGYCAGIDRVFGSRRSGKGYRLAFKDELDARIEMWAENTRNWCDGLPPRLQPHFAHLVSLPHRLTWAFLATLCPGENDHWVAPFVRATITYTLLAQRRFLEEEMLAAEVARQQRARQVMLQKLAANGPCLWRELLRRYSKQRRELHQPVLDALLTEGLIHRRDDGRLELTGASIVKS